MYVFQGRCKSRCWVGGLVCGFLDGGSKHGVGLVGLVRGLKFRLSCDGRVWGEGRFTGCWLGCLF